MTLTVTPQSWNEPPRVRLDIDPGAANSTILTAAVRRNGQLLREQPFVGSPAALAFDYEAPFGVPVTYSVEGTIGIYTTLFAETWDSLSGWTTLSGSPSVLGGYYSGGSSKRTATFQPRGQLVALGLRTLNSAAVASISVGPIELVATATSNTVRYGGGASTIVSGLSGPTRIIWDEVGATVTTSNGTWNVTRTDGGATADVVVSSSNPSAQVDDLIFYNAPTTVAISYTATTTLNVPDAWLIHPSKPALSVPIEMGETGTGVRFIEASSGEQKTSAAVATVHRAVGRARAVVITSGPRQADEWTLVIGAETIVAKNAVRAIVDDQTPLLIRSHPDMNMDLPDDWYSVGDFTVNRVETPIITEMTLMSLPLTPVDEPVVRQGALWSWGNVLTSYATWADVLADNDTWLDVLAGPS